LKTISIIDLPKAAFADRGFDLPSPVEAAFLEVEPFQEALQLASER
jgi:hypothetical protein